MRPWLSTSVQVLDQRPELERFWEELAAADQRILMLDYDGVLAPFHPDPAQATPYPQVPALLDDIRGRSGSRVVIVSGRPPHDVVTLLGTAEAPEVWGSHGHQYLSATGELFQPTLTEDVAAALEQLQRRVRDADFGGTVETKPFGLALHWRGASPAAMDRIRRAGDDLITAAQAEFAGAFVRHDFNGGIELLVAGRNKGNAVTNILGGLDGYRAAYLGDDVTDEDAFRAAPRDVLTVLVRPLLRDTAAAAWITPPDELVSFLRRWDAACA